MDSPSPDGVNLKNPARTKSRSQMGPRSVHSTTSYARQTKLDGDYVYGGGMRRQSRPRFRDEWDNDYDEYERWENVRDPERYWRDDMRNRRPTSRRGPYSRPPQTMSNPAHYNMYQNLGPSDDDNDEHGPVTNEEAHIIASGDAHKRYRAYDEEAGLGPETHFIQRLRSAQTFGDARHGMRLDWQDLSAKEKAEVLRLPWTQWMNSTLKNHFVATVGELIGTTMFLFFAFAGTEVANIRSDAGDQQTTTGEATGFNVAVLLYVSLSFGFSLMVNVWIFFRISGGLFNPAVTIAMVLVKAISITRAVCLFLAQISGAMLASVLVRFLFPESFNVRTTLGGGATLVQGVFIEAILTAELVFTIFMLAKEKHRATFIAPVGIGLALFIAELVGVQFTGGSLNPARSFGPCVITRSFDAEHWIYWVGPLTGSLLAVVFYRFIKTLEYEMANPGADGDPVNDPTKNPEKRAEIRMSRSPSAP
ncbi:aquaporin-like protein [Stachybotrys elegans]|uniref:Aquaporin-like protein n=1 Tax=Stachybotrys elegans TaxID=80388 RepID=A0A8K0SY42_9HYPO|nr:aquaporin-like protein [Stachybotrys elegans]